MAKPLADIDTYVYGTTGIMITAAKDSNGLTHNDLYIYKQYGSNSFILQTSTGEIVPGKFTLTGLLPSGEVIDTSLTGTALAESLELGTCCIVFDDGSAVKPCIDKMLTNKIVLNSGVIVYNNIV